MKFMLLKKESKCIQLTQMFIVYSFDIIFYKNLDITFLYAEKKIVLDLQTYLIKYFAPFTVILL